MGASEQIEIEIDAKGNTRVEGQGFVGPECEKMTVAIEQALGDVQRKTYKPEYRTRVAAGRSKAR